jgi:iron complex transport system ATP-binding protein
MLETTNIVARVGQALLLDQVSFRAAPGDIIGIVGPNGAGKSTLLRILAGLARPTEGTVQLDGTPLGALSRRERARKIAFLPQGGLAESAVTVRQIVALGRLSHGGRGHDAIAINRALDAVGIGELADRAMTSLSGGEQARTLLARALAVEAPYLLADEPTAALDPRHQIDLMEVLQTRAAAGTSVIVILHDLSLAARYCRKLVLLDRGRVAASGPPETLLEPALLESVYGIPFVAGIVGTVPAVLPGAQH